MIEGKVKELIHEKGLIQKHVAKVAGYSEKEFSRLLNGGKVIRDSDVWKISQALGVRPDVLFMNSDKNEEAIKKLDCFSTKNLVEVLKKREGVKTVIAEPYEDVSLSVNGPAIVLIIVD